MGGEVGRTRGCRNEGERCVDGRGLGRGGENKYVGEGCAGGWVWQVKAEERYGTGSGGAGIGAFCSDCSTLQTLQTSPLSYDNTAILRTVRRVFCIGDFCWVFLS